ncbi:MAG TPA: glycosyl hydrolase, partial [Bryobacteraceae bacterium]|nr:glycosyl hydrolase [Bryobacteraceae bacterium]
MLLASHAFSADADLERDFRNPPAEYRSMPLWVWNDELSWPRLQEQLEQFRAQGMGGVFVHPRPGLMTEYLGADWFRFWKSSVDAGKRLGLLVNIYDENSYPAGFAGGHVPARAPDTAAQFVQAIWDAGPGSIAAPGVTVSAFAVLTDAEGRVTFAERIHRAGELSQGRRLLIFRLRRASGNPWTAGFPYVDLTNPQTAPLFLETTYEAYKQHLGHEFGKTIRWAFNDEPLLATAGAYDSAALALPLSYTILAEFQKRCGYDLADRLPSLYWDVGDFRRVRFDYWQTLHDLWKENYFQPLYQWCDRNGLQFTGHWMEHEWPYPWISPDDASMYAFEHMPGIDMLEGSNIRTKGVDPHMLFTITQVASVAHQLGRRAFCEAYGVSGWDSTIEHYKRFGDWLMVHGINFVDQHLAFATVRGARKRDHPQSFTDVAAWWPYYRTHGDHLARVSYLLTRGRPHNRLLLLEATTSGFLWARRGGATPELERMRRDNAELIQALADRQVDFDLGDEYILEWHGKAD